MIITRTADGSLQFVSMGYRESGEDVVLAPFRLATTPAPDSIRVNP